MSLFSLDSPVKKEIVRYSAVVLVSVATCVSFNYAFTKPLGNENCECNKQAVQNVDPQNVNFASQIGENEVVAKIVEDIAPSVVQIRTEKEEKIAVSPHDFFFEDELLKHFFGISPFGERQQQPLTRRSAGTGSGAVISSDGYILTNYHVVKGATKITVKTNDETEYDAKLVGKDMYSDLAVIKVQAKGLKPAKLSDSKKIRPGQWAIAVGSPHGLSHSVTLGIISAVSREIPQLGNVKFIQTDAAINPGNSGGPLLNIKGEIVGINTAILGMAQNIGFAIPVNTAKNIMGDLKSGKKIGHPWIGIAMSPMSEELHQALGVPKGTKGVVIGQVSPNSPAFKGGLEQGDIVQHIDGQKVLEPKDIQEIVRAKKVGDVLNFQILRGNNMLGKKIKVGNWGGE